MTSNLEPQDRPRSKERGRTFVYETFAVQHVAPRGRIRPIHGLLSFVRRHIRLRRRFPRLERLDWFDTNLLEEMERSYVWLLFSGVRWHDAEEIVQSALEKLAEQQGTIPREKRPAWLKSTIRNINQDRRRKWATEQKLAPRVAYELDDPTTGEHTPPDVRLVRRQIDADTQRLLRLLRPEEQAVVELYCFEDMPFKEVAAALEITKNTVQDRWERALSALRAHVDREDAGERRRSRGFNRYAPVFLLLLWEWIRRWFRGIDPACASRARAEQPARWPILAAAVPILALSTFAPCHAVPRPTELSPIEDATASTEVMTASMGLFLSTWAERELEADRDTAIVRSVAHARSTTPRATLPAGPASPATAPSKQKAAVLKDARDLLALAQTALDRDEWIEAGRALQRYEANHRVDPYPEIHVRLRVALGMKTTPR